MPSLGTNIKNLRKEKGLTQEKLAEIMGVTKGTISIWERDLKTPSFAKLDALCDVFNVELSFLRGTSNNRERHVPTQEELDRLGAEAAIEEDIRTFKHYIRMMSKLSESSKRIVYSTIREAYKVDEENGLLSTQL